MTRRDYVLIAAAMRRARPPGAPNGPHTALAAWENCVRHLAYALADGNPKFDVVLFEQNCGKARSARGPIEMVPSDRTD